MTFRWPFDDISMIFLWHFDDIFYIDEILNLSGSSNNPLNMNFLLFFFSSSTQLIPFDSTQLFHHSIFLPFMSLNQFSFSSNILFSSIFNSTFHSLSQLCPPLLETYYCVCLLAPPHYILGNNWLIWQFWTCTGKVALSRWDFPSILNTRGNSFCYVLLKSMDFFHVNLRNLQLRLFVLQISIDVTYSAVPSVLSWKRENL